MLGDCVAGFLANYVTLQTYRDLCITMPNYPLTSTFLRTLFGLIPQFSHYCLPCTHRDQGF
jgi:hypothetical protein